MSELAWQWLAILMAVAGAVAWVVTVWQTWTVLHRHERAIAEWKRERAMSEEPHR